MALKVREIIWRALSFSLATTSLSASEHFSRRWGMLVLSSELRCWTFGYLAGKMYADSHVRVVRSDQVDH